jgi:signal transduction histidine kinase
MLAVQPFMSHITIEPELLAKNDAVCADPDQLRQVFVNLSINAADAIASKKDASGGKIIVKTENEIIKRTEKETVPNIKISVIDNGAGIAEELIDTIFDPFFTTKDPGKGTGLGLWVSFMIVDGIGGKMKANSRVGKGTVMEVILPLHEESRGRK